MVESEPRRILPGQQPPLKEHTSALEESTYKISGILNSITRTQKYFHTRHHRNYSTVLSTQSRILWFTILECIIIVAMSLSVYLFLKKATPLINVPDCKFGFSRLSFHVAEGVIRFKSNDINSCLLCIHSQHNEEICCILVLTNGVSYTISYSRS